MRPGLSLPAFLLALLLLTDCVSSTAPTQQSSPPFPAQAPAPSDVAPERPLPHSPERERGFAQAIQNGPRTASGRPGPHYWQQEVDYDLTARLFPSEKRLEGTATIQIGDATVERVEIDAAHHFPDVNRDNNVWTASD